ncbi:hypothetical protein B4U79_17162 [Dinothrombium tinctorium]|uniref:CCHC-type domain-containing protein n=1 Tax=Dinothrombium tinctorium TaxID=1965070 RepID=A0A443Q648_9ACAR|nr:hypothetical protein B4U79_17162 [Dinothrombium tinctorium]
MDEETLANALSLALQNLEINKPTVPKYDSTKQDIFDWLLTFNALTSNRSDEQKVRLLPFVLETPALRWYADHCRIYKNTTLKWNDWEKALKSSVKVSHNLPPNSESESNKLLYNMALALVEKQKTEKAQPVLYQEPRIESSKREIIDELRDIQREIQRLRLSADSLSRGRQRERYDERLSSDSRARAEHYQRNPIGNPQTRSDNRQCYNCGRNGHIARDCGSRRPATPGRPRSPGYSRQQGNTQGRM